MGLNDTREINLNGTITMSSSVKLSNWKLSTVSKIEDFEWSESPTILVAGKNVPITYIINPTLSIFKSKMAKKIDDAIEKTCDFKPYVLDVLEKMGTPFVTRPNIAPRLVFKLVKDNFLCSPFAASRAMLKRISIATK